jgi:hypothetical protein
VGEDEWQWRAILAQPISPFLKQILCKLLQSATRRRYQSAEEVLADLDVLSNYLPTHLEKVSVQDTMSEIVTKYPDCSTSIPVNPAVLFCCSSSDCPTPKTETSGVAYKVALFISSRLVTAATPPVQKPTSSSSKTALNLISSKRRLSKSLTKDAVELVFTVMSIFILTSIGAIFLLGFFFEMEHRSSPIQPQIQPASPASQP